MENFQVSRRQFVQYVAGAAAAMGLSQASVVKLTEQLSAGAWTKPEVIFLEGQVCGGCETSLAGLRFPGGHEILDALGISNTPSQMYLDGGASLMGSNSSLAGLLGAKASSTATAPTMEDNAWPGARYQNDSAVTIDDVAIDVLDIKIIRILGSTAGEGYYDVIKQYMPGEGGTKKGHVCVFTGAIPINGPNKVGEEASVSGYSYKDKKPMTTAYMVRELAKNAAAVFMAGTCASYGGIPAGKNRNYNSKTGDFKYTGAVQVATVLSKAGIKTPIVRVPNCPVNNKNIFLSIAQLLVDLAGAKDTTTGITTFKKRLDSDGRLKQFNVTIPQGSGPSKTISIDMYNQTVHGKKCPRYKFYAKSFYVSNYDQVGCFYYRGCKGPFTNAPCTNSGPDGGWWNDFAGAPVASANAQSVATTGGNCMKGGHPCIGCANKNHPFDPVIKY